MGVDKDHKAFSTTRTLTDNTLYSASSPATLPSVQSMTVLYDNTQYIPWLNLFENLCSHSDLSGLMPVSQPIKRKYGMTCDSIWKYSWHNSCNLEFAWKGWVKPWKSLIRIVGAPAKIPTGYLLNKILKYWTPVWSMESNRHCRLKCIWARTNYKTKTNWLVDCCTCYAWQYLLTRFSNTHNLSK
jgi:hypothetical protein